MEKNQKLIIPVVLLVSAGCLFAVIAVVCVSSTGLLAARLLASSPQPDQPVEWQTVEEGEPAPDFELETLTGDKVRLSDLQGDPVVLSFGASWCPPCRDEVLTLQGLHETYPSLQVMMIDIGEGYWTVHDFADEFGLTFTVALDLDGWIALNYGVEAIPALFFIDESGRIQATSIGAPRSIEMEMFLERIGIKSGGG